MALEQYLAGRKAALKEKNRDALVMTHVVCGYPSFDDNWQVLEIMQEAGVDLVELQFPFSEPSADGPLFVKANQMSIENGTTVQDCFDFMKKVTAHFDFEVVMMGYYNTVFKTGTKRFLQKLKDAGGIGFILPDLPVDEADEVFQNANDLDLSQVILMTPTNTKERLAQLASAAKGFVYTVARKGVTGSQTEMNQEVVDFIESCREVTELPLAVGFGVSTKADIDFIGQHADIAVIGTAALKAWEQGKAAGLKAFFKQLLDS